MRLSGDPVPLLPADAPRSEISGWRAELGLRPPLARAVRRLSRTSSRGIYGRSIHLSPAGPSAGALTKNLPATLQLGLTHSCWRRSFALPIGRDLRGSAQTRRHQARWARARRPVRRLTFFIGILLILGRLPEPRLCHPGRESWASTGDCRRSRSAPSPLRPIAGSPDRRYARGAAGGLRPHRAGKGVSEALCDRQAHAQERAVPIVTKSPGSSSATLPRRGRGGRRRGVRMAGHGAARDPVDLQPRLFIVAVHGVPLRPALHR